MFKKLKLACQDFKQWYSVKRHIPVVGYINGYIACSGQPFGSGKTLSCISELERIIKKYDGSKVDGKILHINVLSNISLNFKCSCFKEIKNLQEIVTFLENRKEEEDSLNFTYILLDEIGTEFNSRSFSKNFSSGSGAPEFLTKLVTVRHYNCAVLYTAQSFFMVDKIFRDLTTNIFICKHFWRYYKNLKYMPSDFENYADISQVRPLGKNRFFAYPELFEYYDSAASFYTLKDKLENDDYICSTYEKEEQVFNVPTRLKKKEKKKYK